MSAAGKIVALFPGEAQKSKRTALLTLIEDPTVKNLCLDDSVPDEDKKAALVAIIEKKSEDELTKKAKLLEVLKKDETKFTVNGTIRDTTGLFFVPPEGAAKKLAAEIVKKSYIMLQGHRGSGKSTLATYTILNYCLELGCLPIAITLQASIAVNSPTSFWKGFGKRLDHELEVYGFKLSKPIESGQDFLDFLDAKKSNPSMPPIALFVDEFDHLLQSLPIDALTQQPAPSPQQPTPSATADITDTALGDFLNTLRSIKEKRTDEYKLQSVVIIGPISILKAGRIKLSPFNVSDTIEAAYFTQEEVKQLFADFIRISHLTLEDGIVEDIFARTKGHQALTCFCGKKIQETLLVNSKTHLTLAEWLKFATSTLVANVPNAWATVSKLVATISVPENSKFLIQYALNTREPFQVRTGPEEVVAKELAAEGALRLDLGTNTYQIPSSLVRALIMKHIVPPPFVLPVDFVPVNAQGYLDVESLLLLGLPVFDATTMKRAPKQSFKGNRATGADVKRDAPVPQEACYQTQLILLLRACLPKNWTLDTEANAGSKSCDVVVHDPLNSGFALELVAHVPETGRDKRGSVEEHFVRCSEYYHVKLGCKESWVINFTTRKPSSANDAGYPWPLSSDNIRAAHVWHDLDWQNALITVDRDPQHPKRVVLHR